MHSPGGTNGARDHQKTSKAWTGKKEKEAGSLEACTPGNLKGLTESEPRWECSRKTKKKKDHAFGLKKNPLRKIGNPGTSGDCGPGVTISGQGQKRNRKRKCLLKNVEPTKVPEVMGEKKTRPLGGVWPECKGKGKN